MVDRWRVVMARRTRRPPITRTLPLLPVRQQCSTCGSRLWHLYQTQRTVTTLEDVSRLSLTVVRCPNPACVRYHQPVRPEEEGAWALPHGEFGLDVLALIGALRYREHRSVPEIHKALQDQHVAIAPRSVTYLLERYEELLALHLADQTRLKHLLTQQGHLILAIDGLQPFKSQDVLWVLRDTLSGEVLLARSLDSARQEDIADLLREVKDALPVPIHAVISDAQRPIRLAVQQVLPAVPHQLCQFHYLKEAAKPITEADRHAKTELKKYTRGVREIEREVAERKATAAATIRSYCLAVRSALSDDGKPPLPLPGLCCASVSAPFSPHWSGWRKRGASERAGATARGGGARAVCHRAALGTPHHSPAVACARGRGACQQGAGERGEGGGEVSRTA